MKILFLLFPFLVLSQNAIVQKKKVTLHLDLEIVDRKILERDTIYICKDKTRVRISKDSVFVYRKNQYFKFKKS